uniref:Uncharacterized protein n=1 Tax=Lotus japonicus TaxID=34305 RepID=I3SQ28_LOTJA|nr:unknown [Lotus japonicus]
MHLSLYPNKQKGLKSLLLESPWAHSIWTLAGIVGLSSGSFTSVLLCCYFGYPIVLLLSLSP